MRRIYELKPKWALVVYVVLDVICVGMGMGVPIFNILFGFLVGWVIVGMVASSASGMRQALKRILRYGLITSAVTFVGLAALWGSTMGLLFDPEADFVEFGIPMILYDPLASFIGWQVLMIIISPFLQLLTTVFGAHVALLYGPGRDIDGAQ